MLSQHHVESVTTQTYTVKCYKVYPPPAPHCTTCTAAYVWCSSIVAQIVALWLAGLRLAALYFARLSIVDQLNSSAAARDVNQLYKPAR
eukprot:scaffold46055_cov56-Cyclotella_meneghiniana.AAC.1